MHSVWCRVLIPAKFCKQVLYRRVTCWPPGIVQIKSLVRLHVWWPVIDIEIETIVCTCTVCQYSEPSTTNSFIPLGLAKPTMVMHSLCLSWSLLRAYLFAGGGCTFNVDRGSDDDFHHHRENHYRVVQIVCIIWLPRTSHY